jgi:hypothetical protein
MNDMMLLLDGEVQATTTMVNGRPVTTWTSRPVYLPRPTGVPFDQRTPVSPIPNPSSS